MSRGTAPTPGLFPLEDSDDSGIKLPLDGITVSPAPCHPDVNEKIFIQGFEIKLSLPDFNMSLAIFRFI